MYKYKTKFRVILFEFQNRLKLKNIKRKKEEKNSTRKLNKTKKRKKKKEEEEVRVNTTTTPTTVGVFGKQSKLWEKERKTLSILPLDLLSDPPIQTRTDTQTLFPVLSLEFHTLLLSAINRKFIILLYVVNAYWQKPTKRHYQIRNTQEFLWFTYWRHFRKFPYKIFYNPHPPQVTTSFHTTQFISSFFLTHPSPLSLSLSLSLSLTLTHTHTPSRSRPTLRFRLCKPILTLVVHLLLNIFKKTP